MTSRRTFLLHSAVAAAAVSAGPLAARGAAPSAKQRQPLNVGIAGYTFAKFDLDHAIRMMKRVGVNHLSIKDFHLPLDSSPAQIKAVMDKLSAAQIDPYAVGVIYMKSEKEVDRAFRYARAAGVNLIVGVPTPELLDYTEQQVKRYGIRLAIHNHGPEDKLYPGPSSVYAVIKNRDPRMGLCLDIGHAMRAGEEPSRAVREYSHRIFDLHIKDVSMARRDGQAVEAGRGVIDFPALVKALYRIRYAGQCSIEFEKDMSDPLPGIAESVGYFKGVVRTLAV